MKIVFLQKKSNQHAFLTICLSSLISACASNAPAPVYQTVIINNANNSSQAITPQSQKETDQIITEGKSSETSKNISQLKPQDNFPIQQNPPSYAAPDKRYSIKAKDTFNGYICEDAPRFIGKSIGDGECVDLIKLCSNAPLTRYWKAGDYVFGKDIPTGAAIATFRRGKYPNKHGYHAAIYSHQDKNGIYAWDQWRGKPVHLRYIQANQRHKDAGNNASKYRIIKR